MQWRTPPTCTYFYFNLFSLSLRIFQSDGNKTMHYSPSNITYQTGPNSMFYSRFLAHAPTICFTRCFTGNSHPMLINRGTMKSVPCPNLPTPLVRSLCSYTPLFFCFLISGEGVVRCGFFSHQVSHLEPSNVVSPHSSGSLPPARL